MFLWWSSTKVVQAIWICQKNMAASGRSLFSLYSYIENLKNLLVRNHWTDFHIILQKCSFGDPLPRLFKPFGFIKKHSRQGGRGLFSLYICIEKLEKSSCQKPLDRLHVYYNLAKLFPWWPSTKIVQVILICQKTWLLGGWSLFSLHIYIENLKKSSCQKPLDRFQYTLAEMFPWWPFTKIVQAVMICQKTWLLGGGAYFPYIYIYIENLTKSSCQKPLNITWQICFLGDPLPRLFKLSWFVKKHGWKGAGLIFPVYLHRKL